MIKSHYGNFWIQPKYHVMENHTMENHVMEGITVFKSCISLLLYALFRNKIFMPDYN